MTGAAWLLEVEKCISDKSVHKPISVTLWQGKFVAISSMIPKLGFTREQFVEFILGHLYFVKECPA